MKKLLLPMGTVMGMQVVNQTNAADLSLKVIDKEPPGQIGESIRKTLQPKTVQLQSGDKPVFEFWFSSEVPLKSKPGSSEKALDAIRETTLIGAAAVGSGQ